MIGMFNISRRSVPDVPEDDFVVRSPGSQDPGVGGRPGAGQDLAAVTAKGVAANSKEK